MVIVSLISTVEALIACSGSMVHSEVPVCLISLPLFRLLEEDQDKV